MFPLVHCPYIRRQAVFCRQAPQTLTHMEATLMHGYSRYHVSYREASRRPVFPSQHRCRPRKSVCSFIFIKHVIIINIQDLWKFVVAEISIHKISCPDQIFGAHKPLVRTVFFIIPDTSSLLSRKETAPMNRSRRNADHPVKGSAYPEIRPELLPCICCAYRPLPAQVLFCSYFFPSSDSS